MPRRPLLCSRRRWKRLSACGVCFPMTRIGISLSLVTVLVAAGCSFTRVESFTPRTATEELLVTKAFERVMRDVELPDVTGRAVAIEMAMIGPGEEFADDAAFAKALVEAAVARNGGRIVGLKEADLVLTAIVSTLATTGRSAMIGVPAMSAGVIATPEIPILKVMRERGYARLQLVGRDGDGRFVSQSSPVMRKAEFDLYSVFFIAFRSNDIYDEFVVGIE
jgi:hypothetical protein